MAKRVFDIISAAAVLIVFFPIILILSLLIYIEDHGPVFFKQVRVGKDGKLFQLYKFRTMRVDAERYGQITVGGKDPRITKIGYYLRKLKLDEIPQLINVLKGEMSVVGPRPEVEKYVKMYTEEQRRILSVRPGLTDYASIEFINENELLGDSEDPLKTYTELIMPAKLALNLKYILDQNFWLDIKLIFRTIFKIFK